LTAQTPNPVKVNTPKFNRKAAFQVGMAVGGILGILLSTGCSFLYLFISQDTASVKNGRMSFNKAVNTFTVSEIASPSTKGDGNANPLVKGDQNAVASSSGIASSGSGVVNSGDNAQVTRDPKDSLNRKDSPSIVGNNNHINIVSRDLPGFDEKSYLSTPPSDLRKYTQVSDFQPSTLIQSASDERKIDFNKKEIVILGKPYTSFFDVSWYAQESRFVFKLDGSQKAAILQFGLPDLASGSASKGHYIVKIYADGTAIWAGECRLTQGNQLISVPLELAGKSTLAIEVTSDGNNQSNLYFTKASILKD
jgi:hypothetical protein